MTEQPISPTEDITQRWMDRITALEQRLRDAEQRAEHYKAALVALAKVQYDGTVEGLRYQIDHGDWGDVLDPVETTAAYELTLAALEEPRE